MADAASAVVGLKLEKLHLNNQRYLYSSCSRIYPLA
jgi:hypothetical protein